MKCKPFTNGWMFDKPIYRDPFFWVVFFVGVTALAVIVSIVATVMVALGY